LVGSAEGSSYPGQLSFTFPFDLVLAISFLEIDDKAVEQKMEGQKHTTGGIPRWSPTLVLVARFSAYVWQSGRDAQFSLTYGRMYSFMLTGCL
jgi:hypothetical protein